MHPALRKHEAKAKRKLPKSVIAYLSENGRKGGQKSKRKITPEQQAKMQAARERHSRL